MYIYTGAAKASMLYAHVRFVDTLLAKTAHNAAHQKRIHIASESTACKCYSRKIEAFFFFVGEFVGVKTIGIARSEWFSKNIDVELETFFFFCCCLFVTIKVNFLRFFIPFFILLSSRRER